MDNEIGAPEPLADDLGCFPVGITKTSLGGINISNGDIYPTGTYPIDVWVCRPQYATCKWYNYPADMVQEGGPMPVPPDPYFPVDLTPLMVSVFYDVNFVYFNFTLPSGVTWPGWSEPIDRIDIDLLGDLGARTYTTTIADLVPAMYYLGVPIANSTVQRSGGGWVVPQVIKIKIPRLDTGVKYWSACCDKITWKYTVHATVNPGDFNTCSYLDNFVTGDIYPAEVKKFVEVYKTETQTRSTFQ
jgi:hypothetical protein